MPYFFRLGKPLADPLHGQLALHLGDGAQDGQHELKHVIIVAGIKTLFYKINSHIVVKVRVCYPLTLFRNWNTVRIRLQRLIYKETKIKGQSYGDLLSMK